MAKNGYRSITITAFAYDEFYKRFLKSKIHCSFSSYVVQKLELFEKERENLIKLLSQLNRPERGATTQ